jgi:16S rRNA (uracil1498-N3)-methyltransferase
LAQLQRLTILPEQRQQQSVLLTPEQQHYLGHVLRLRPGDRFVVMDGQGGRWLAQLQTRDQAQLLEAAPIDTELPYLVTLIAALPKGNGFDAVVHQATELGVSQILPVLSDRTLLQPSEHKLLRWQRIAQEAAEQSQRQQVPIIAPPVNLLLAIKQAQANLQESQGRGYFCTTATALPLATCLQRNALGGVAIATGPEGGWTDAEIAQFIAQEFEPVSLGARTLRAITAPTVALALIAARLEV